MSNLPPGVHGQNIPGNSLKDVEVARIVEAGLAAWNAWVAATQAAAAALKAIDEEERWS